jgi:hypothetical protein
MIIVEGAVINDDTIRATARRILAAKRRALGMEPVDLTNLVEGGRDLNTPVIRDSIAAATSAGPPRSSMRPSV